MTPASLPRRAIVVLLAALAGCGGDPPPPVIYQPLSYDYLAKLRLNVASLAVDDGWAPVGGEGLQHAEYLSPMQPLDALRRLAADRLVADGNTGQARFVIEDASIFVAPGRLDGSIAVRLDVSTSNGARSGFAEAKVVRSLSGGPDDADGGRDAAYRLTRQMMDDMNVELEFQIRRNLRDYLQATDPVAPAPKAVQTQELEPPPGVTLAPPLPPPP